MKVGFGTVTRDVQLTTLALAIAFGLALINTAEGARRAQPDPQQT
jgi:hypothetical protein